MCSNMSSVKTAALLLLICVLLLKQTAADGGHDALVSFSKKKSQSLQEASNTGRQAQLPNKIPPDFTLLFKTTVYVQAALFCAVLSYGVFHLQCWATLFQRLVECRRKPQSSEFSEQFEMVMMKLDEEDTDSDVIVNYSDEEV